MNTMKMPGFTAHASLYKMSGHYHTDRHVANFSIQAIGALYPAAKGQDFPDHKCTCKGCGPQGGDVTGQCANVCKDKDVFSKGSESYDYCKAAKILPPIVVWHHPVDVVAFSL